MISDVSTERIQAVVWIFGKKCLMQLLHGALEKTSADVAPGLVDTVLWTHVR